FGQSTRFVLGDGSSNQVFELGRFVGFHRPHCTKKLSAVSCMASTDRLFAGHRLLSSKPPFGTTSRVSGLFDSSFRSNFLTIRLPAVKLTGPAFGRRSGSCRRLTSTSAGAPPPCRAWRACAISPPPHIPE